MTSVDEDRDYSDRSRIPLMGWGAFPREETGPKIQPIPPPPTPQKAIEKGLKRGGHYPRLLNPPLWTLYVVVVCDGMAIFG